MNVRAIFTPFKSKDILSKHDILTRLAWNMHNNRLIMVDRFGYLNKFSEYSLFGDEKFPTPFEYSFKDICEEVAYRIVSKSEDKFITVMWSGGVDSTCIIASLIKTGISISKLKVLYTDESVKENNSFFNFLTQSNIDCVNICTIDIIKLRQLIDLSYVITGCCADSLFEEISYYSFRQYWNVDYKKYLSDVGMKEDIPIIEDMFKFYGISVKTTQQFSYMIDFCCHFTVDSLVFPTILRNDKNLIRFFTNEMFQRWSIYRFLNNTISMKDERNYKQEMKEIIVEVTKDSSYYNMTKQYSRYKISYLIDYIPFSYRDKNNNIVLMPQYYKTKSLSLIMSKFFNRLLRKE